LWGKAAKEISSQNSPASPLGEGSVLDWLAGTGNSFVLMLGTHFDSLSFGHYIEIKAQVPWYDYFCWDHLGKEKVGVSVSGEQSLKEIPGCSKSFINFESYLVESKIIQANSTQTLEAYYTPVEMLMKTGISYFRNNCKKLLCVSGSCKACDVRRDKFVK
jgi:aminoglycoside N3'-acetyltransferase